MGCIWDTVWNDKLRRYYHDSDDFLKCSFLKIVVLQFSRSYQHDCTSNGLSQVRISS